MSPASAPAPAPVVAVEIAQAMPVESQPSLPTPPLATRAGAAESSGVTAPEPTNETIPAAAPLDVAPSPTSGKQDHNSHPSSAADINQRLENLKVADTEARLRKLRNLPSKVSSEDTLNERFAKLQVTRKISLFLLQHVLHPQNQ
jgi:hypothetical protein